MSPQRYQPVNSHDAHDDDVNVPTNSSSPPSLPSSSPPSFRSRNSSPTSARLLSQEDPLYNEADRTLADTFDDGEPSDAEDGGDDRQRLMRADTDDASREARQQNLQDQPSPVTTNAATPGQRSSLQRNATALPLFSPNALRTQPTGGNDGVFANLAAKPERGEVVDEKPPTYEAAAADAAPPYWETTITLPGSGLPGSDEVYIEGLPVGSVFSFAWNAMISVSFQLIGFLLTYLLHTTHAAKNGSRAGLGLTLVQYGFYMKGSNKDKASPTDGGASAQPPTDPNSHDDPDPDSVAAAVAAAAASSSTTSSASSSSQGLSGLASSDWFSYILMIIGWFILIRAVADFLRARRHEQLVLQSPDRGLPVPVIAEGEQTERVV